MDVILTPVFSGTAIFTGVLTLLLGCYVLSWMLGGPSKRLPPGPREWGTNWTILKASLNGTIAELAGQWAKKYGDMTYVNCLGEPILFLNSTEVTRRLLSSEQYKFLVADRFQTVACRVAKFNGKDLVFSKCDDIMRKKRRLFYSLIGHYGDGVEKFENVVWGEMERMFTEIDKSEEDDVEVTKVLVRSLKIIIYILAMGELPADPTIPDVLEEFDLAMNKLLRPDVDFVLTYLPFMTYLPGKFKNLVAETLLAKERTDELLYYGPKRTYVPGKPRGMTDLLMDYQKKPGYEWLEKDEEHILAFLGTLFMAGIFLCLLNYPKVTEKIREEVDRVIGDQRPKIEHKSSMSYTEATILEGLRILSPLPLSGFRRAAQDLDYEGMLIPKNTLRTSLQRLSLSPKTLQSSIALWSSTSVAQLYSPLGLTEVYYTLCESAAPNLIAFGIGARACPGEVFARSRVFLIITSILQRYDLLPPANEKLPPADFQDQGHLRGVVTQTPPCKCRLIRRRHIH